MGFIFSILLIIICSIIGNVVGNLISNYFVTKSLQDSIFKKSDFIDCDSDFFSPSEKSITDINSEKIENDERCRF